MHSASGDNDPILLDPRSRPRRIEHDELDKMMPGRSTDPGPLDPHSGPLVPDLGPLVQADDRTESQINVANNGPIMSPQNEVPRESSPPATR